MLAENLLNTYTLSRRYASSKTIPYTPTSDPGQAIEISRTGGGGGDGWGGGGDGEGRKTECILQTVLKITIQDSTILGKCIHLYDKTQGTTKHKRFW